MLREFALTPQVFEQASHGGDVELRDCLRELGSNLFPNTAVWPAVVSDLHGGTWWKLIEPELRKLTQTPTGALLRNLLERLPQILVQRPGCLDWPDSEAEWLDEACRTHGHHPSHRVLVSEAHFPTLDADFQTPDRPRVRSLSAIFEPGFWNDVQPTAAPEMSIRKERNGRISYSGAEAIDKQVTLLRTIAVHTDVIHLFDPYIRGQEGGKGEIDLAWAELGW